MSKSVSVSSAAGFAPCLLLMVTDVVGAYLSPGSFPGQPPVTKQHTFTQSDNRSFYGITVRHQRRRSPSRLSHTAGRTSSNYGVFPVPQKRGPIAGCMREGRLVEAPLSWFQRRLEAAAARIVPASTEASCAGTRFLRLGFVYGQGAAVHLRAV